MPQPNCYCASCGTPIYRSPTAIAQSKTGLFWCSQAHRRSSGVLKLHSYRKLAFDNYPHVCDECGYKDYPDILEVHHVNMNHADNRLHNLRILCPTHHREAHFIEGGMEAMGFDYPDSED